MPLGLGNDSVTWPQKQENAPSLAYLLARRATGRSPRLTPPAQTAIDLTLYVFPPPILFHDGPSGKSPDGRFWYLSPGAVESSNPATIIAALW